MPHIVVTHTHSLATPLSECVGDMSDFLCEAGVNPDAIKIYFRQTHQTYVAGKAQADLVHIEARFLRKAERTDALLRAWLVSLMDIVSVKLTSGCSLTGEVNFLPDIYISKTA